LSALEHEHGARLVLVDARSSEAYAEGHLPGAISLPGSSLRTAKAKPGEGDSQYIFRLPDDSADVAHYEQLLGKAGIGNESVIVVYGNHGGKTDGSLLVMLLDWLGHEQVYFLDGIGVDVWLAAGQELSQEPTVRTASTFDATPDADFLVNLTDVQAALALPAEQRPIFYDTRSLGEFEGSTLRSNARGGHIPEAVHADYAELLTADKTLKPLAEIKEILARLGLFDEANAGRPIVLYCQTSTRVSLPYLVLHDLGFDDVRVYDASWHEYGNRDDTVVATQ
jgi:thiosulfate/3-mercaptopyruvate sulfurtransferase